jgi:hypothetical protein
VPLYPATVRILRARSMPTWYLQDHSYLDKYGRIHCAYLCPR